MVLMTGKACDKFSPKIMIPFAFFFQLFAMLIYLPVKDPSSWAAYLCACFQGGSGNVFVVCTQSYVAKRTPKMVRGTVFSWLAISSCIGCIIYLKVAYYTMLYLGPQWAFISVALIDLVFLIPVLVFIYFGMYC